jgi:hypothetical protein
MLNIGWHAPRFASRHVPCVTSHWRRGVPSNMQTGSIRVKIFCAAAVIALLAGPAYAQSQSVPRYGDTDKKKSPQEIEAEREAERAYKRSLGNIPDQAPTDPWGNVRSDGAPKAAAKASPAKRTKTGNTAN